jgi:hypothetical protein
MDLTADGWTWNQQADAFVRIIDAGDKLEIQAALPITGTFTYDPAASDDTDPAEQVEQIISILVDQLDHMILPPGIEWLDGASLNPEQVGHAITNLIRTGRSFVYIAPGDTDKTRVTAAGTRPQAPPGSPTA